MTSRYVLAAMRGDLASMKKYLNKRVNVNTIDENGCNVYILAAQNGHLKCMLQAKVDGVNVNQIDIFGEDAHTVIKWLRNSRRMTKAINDKINTI